VMCMRPKGEMEQLKHSLLEAMVGEEGA
jgi:hypothetical protein